MGVDSGAEVTVWPPNPFPEVATVESEESRRGVKYFGLGAKKKKPTLPKLGTRQKESQSWPSLQESKC